MGFILNKTHTSGTMITREYRLVRDFTFIMPYEVSRAFYLGALEQTHSKATETNSLTFLLLLLRRYEVVLESYLVHDHV